MVSLSFSQFKYIVPSYSIDVWATKSHSNITNRCCYETVTLEFRNPILKVHTDILALTVAANVLSMVETI